MIEASFDIRSRGAAVSGAYQYDTGQRMVMRGLPSPDELSEMDSLLAGSAVSVQAHYSFVGDGQTESRIALWDDTEGAWVAAVPDAYLMRSADVRVYVYVSYGSTEESMRAKTFYEAVFRPISRPAPSDKVTPDQTSAFDSMMSEFSVALTSMSTATSGANAAATRASEMADRLDATTAEAVTLAPGSAATAEVTDLAGRKHIVIGVPQGKQGEQGVPGVFKINGQEVTNEAEINLTHDDVGALPADHQTVFEFTATIPSLLWNPIGVPGVFLNSVAVEGILRTDRPIIDIDCSDPTVMEEIYESWETVQSITTYDGGITITCYMETPPVPIPIKLLCVR